MFKPKPYYEIKAKKVFEVLEKYPDVPSRTLARMLKRDNPELFRDIEDARYAVRYRRGATGDHRRKELKDKKYVKQIQSA